MIGSISGNGSSAAVGTGGNIVGLGSNLGLETTQHVHKQLEGLGAIFDYLVQENITLKTEKEALEKKLNMQIEEFKQIEQVIQELEHTIKKIKLDHEKEVSHLLEQNRQLLQVQQTVVQDVQRQQHQLVAAATAAATAKSATTTTDNAQIQQQPSMPLAASNLGMEVEQPPNSAEKADVEMPVSTDGLSTAEKSAESTNTTINAMDSNANDDNNNAMTTDTNDTNSISNNTNISTNEIKKEPDNDCNPAYLSNSTTNNGSNSTSAATAATAASVTNSDLNSIDFSIKLEHVMAHNSVVSCVKFSPDGRFLATGSKKMVQLFSASTGEKVSIYTVDYDSSTGVNTGRVYDPPSDYPPSPQSSVLASDDSRGSSSAQASRNDPYIRSVCFSPDNRLLGTGSEDKYIRFWSIPEKRLLRTWNGFDVIYSLEFTHDGTKLVSASGDNKARIWDSETGTLLHTLESSPSSMASSLNAPGTEGCTRDGLTSVAISPDGRYIATGSLDRVVRLWDAETSLLAGSFEGHTDSVYSVAFSPDGKTLASGSLDKTIKLWDVAAGGGHGCRATLNGHQNFVLSVAYSPDGKWIVSGSKDRTVQFWDAQSYKQCKMLQGHKNSVISVAISPNGGLFATGSGDSRARLWSYSVVKV